MSMSINYAGGCCDLHFDVRLVCLDFSIVWIDMSQSVVVHSFSVTV